MKQELQTICNVLFGEPLSRYTSIRVGGPADALAYPKTIEELLAIAQWARKNNLPLFVLGAGSNILVRDKGLRGVVVNLSQGFGRVEVEKEEGDVVILYAEAGVGLPRLVDFSAEEGFSGLEGLTGIPGNVGGALVMNAGTPNGEIADAVVSVTFLDPKGAIRTWAKEEIRYAYRESHFPRGSILISARLKTSRLASEKIRGKIQQYRASRLETQPLNVPNLGSVFKNPDKKGMHAGRLIEEAGLKNIRVGKARISPKHGNWIVNEGGATARDVLALMGLMKDKVKEKFGITLESEVKIVGEE